MNLYTHNKPNSVAATRARAASALLALIAGALTLGGCASTKYELAPKDTPPPVAVNLATAQPQIEMTLDTVLTYKGPGSWKREAMWDEYVVTVHNRGVQPLTIGTPTLVDLANVDRTPGIDPWALEKQSLVLEKQYRHEGVDFVRTAGPAVAIVGAGAATIGAVGVFSAAAGTAAAATVVALPVYYLVVLDINHSNKLQVKAEFTRRRLPLPLTLAAGETRTGSLFFPTVPNPQSLHTSWSSDSDSGVLALSLEPLQGLHVASPALQASVKPR